mgnify:CR=1 FL=1
MKAEVAECLLHKFSGKNVEHIRLNGIELFKVGKEKIKDFLLFCKSEESLDFSFFENLVCTDRKSTMELTYQLLSLGHRHRINVRVVLSPDELSLASADQMWRAAGLCELEIFELFGVNFEGNAKIKASEHFLLSKDWQGFPMRRTQT